MKMTVFRDDAPSSPVETGRRFIGVYCLYLCIRRRENLKYHLINLFWKAILHYVWGFETFIGLIMEAVSTSEMSVNFYKTTWRNAPQDSHLHIRRRKNLKSHLNLNR
jgi:hypothetical protein